MARTSTSKASQAKEATVQTSFLDSLPIIALPPKTVGKGGDPVLGGRLMLLNGIKNQRKLVQDEIEGKEPDKTVFKVDGKERTRVAGRWYTKVDNDYVSTLRYGQIPLVKTKQGDKEVAAYWPAGKTLEDVLDFYKKLEESIEKGEVDDHIKAVQGSRKTAS